MSLVSIIALLFFPSAFCTAAADDAIHAQLMDLVGYDEFDFLTKILQHRGALVAAVRREGFSAETLADSWTASQGQPGFFAVHALPRRACPERSIQNA